MRIKSPTNADQPPGIPRRREPTSVRARRGMSLARRRALFAYALLIPAVLFVSLLIAYPLLLALQLSFTPGRFAGLRQAGTGVSLEQFRAVLGDPGTVASVSRSAIYVVGTIAPAFLLGLLVALLLRHPFPGRRWLRTLILLPWAVPGVAASAIFLWMLDASFGVINKILLSLHLLNEPVAWYASPSTAMFAVILPTAWKLFPFFAMILLASLQTVSTELYEAARVDGAGAAAQFRNVTWPGIRGPAYAALIIASLGVYREFDFIFPLTRGGPDDSTTTLAISIYQQAFQFSNMGFASALGMLSTLIAGVFVLAGSRVLLRSND